MTTALAARTTRRSTAPQNQNGATAAFVQPAPAGGLDIMTVGAAETAEVVLIHPVTKADTGGRILIRSMQSHAQRDLARRVRAKLVISSEGKTEMSQADASEGALDATTSATVSWNLTRAGEPIPCTSEEVRALYSSVQWHWIHEQVLSAYTDVARFFVGAKASS